jgi:hypothetical protein
VQIHAWVSPKQETLSNQIIRIGSTA